MVRLSILEQMAVVSGVPHEKIVQEAVELAKLSEEWGYDGYWLAEHHNSEAMVSSAPEIVIAAVASVTKKMQIGAAGIMLSHYAPYKVAEQFNTLASLYPRRIRLGLGRSRGTETASKALRTNSRDFVEELGALLSFLRGATDNLTTELSGIHAMPKPETPAAPFCLATSENGALSAAKVGLPLIFNYSDGAHNLEKAVSTYRRAFKPSLWSSKPKVSLLVWTLVAPTVQEAEWLFLSRAYWRLMLMRGERVSMVPPENFAGTSMTDEEMQVLSEKHASYFVGEPDTIAQRINHLAATVGAEEVLTTSWAYDLKLKRRSHKLLVQAFKKTQSDTKDA
jgi:luciferase family oxidoreductase group 1